MVFLRKGKMLELLDQEDINKMHLASLELLEKVGVKVFSEQARKILERSGAKVDHKSQMAWIPPYLVEEALRKAPRSFVLYAGSGENDVKLDGNHISCITDGTGLATIDLEKGERRTSTKDDVARSALIIDALDYADIYLPLVIPQDFPKHSHVLHEYDAAMNNTQKHFLSGSVLLPKEAVYLVKMAAAVAGGLEELRKKPIISAAACPLCPMILPRDETDAGLEFAKHGVPVVPATMPLIGATGPITVAGSVIIGNVPILAMNTVIQMEYPGAPVIYSSYAMSMELRTGAFATSFPGAVLAMSSNVQLARYYGLPSWCLGTITSAKIPDQQAAYEKAVCGLMAMLVGSDICGALGMLENFTTLSYEQILIDYEMYTMMVKIAGGIDVNDETMALNTISKVGPEGHFLSEKHTLAHTKDVWMPIISDATQYATWKQRGGKSAVDVAREKVKEILETHKPTPLDKDVKKELAAIIKEAEDKLPH